MPQTLYDRNIIREPFYPAGEDFGGGTIFKHTDDDRAGVVFEYHCINRPDWSIKQSVDHDNWELLCFLGGNPENIDDLGAEVSLFLGDAGEEHIIANATVVSVPPGLKHGPITIKKYSRPFVLFRVLTTREYEDRLSEAAVDTDIFSVKNMKNGNDVTKNGKRYWMNIVRGPFFFDYEPGWTGTSIWAHNNEYKNGTTLGYHCVNSTYDVRFNHAHDFHELLCFLGGDPENVADLGAEVSICLGDEMEEHTFNTPTIVSMPPGLKHCPLLIKNVTRPIVFLEVSMTKGFGARPPEKQAQPSAT